MRVKSRYIVCKLQEDHLKRVSQLKFGDILGEIKVRGILAGFTI